MNLGCLFIIKTSRSFARAVYFQFVVAPYSWSGPRGAQGFLFLFVLPLLEAADVQRNSLYMLVQCLLSIEREALYSRTYGFMAASFISYIYPRFVDVDTQTSTLKR